MIALVTVTYNSETVLDDFLDSVRRQDIPVRLYAIDNDSHDGSARRLQAIDDLDLVFMPQDHNLGIAVGNNIGIARALDDGAEWILLVNNDTSFEPTLASRLVSTARARQAGIVVPSIRYFDQPEVVWFEAARFDHWRGSIPVVLPPAAAGSIRPIDCANTCCALVHRSVFDKVGLMDESYFVYWDDIDFFLRCSRADVAMYLDSGARLLHKVSSLTGGGESDFSQRERIKNRAYYIRKHSTGLTKLIGLVLTAVNACKLAAAGPERLKRLARLTRALADGCRIPVPSQADRQRPQRPY